jgi:hypothetical protein
MKEISATARLIWVAITVAVVAPMSAQTGAWTPSVVISTGGQGWEATAAIDGNGNSVALWDERTTQDQIWSRSKTSGANWGSVTEISPALQTTYVFPAVRITTAGFATAVWSDQGGVWTADRTSAFKWEPAQLLIPGASNPIFVMNARGDGLDRGRWSKEYQRRGNGRSATCRGSLDGTTDSCKRRASVR